VRVRRPILSTLVALVALVSAATSSGQQAPTLLDRYDFEARSARFELPARLDEISGLAITPDGRLFGHHDEWATVYEIDRRTGATVKGFSLGDPAEPGDFEGMAIVGERFFLITSSGLLYEFREVGDREEAPFRVTDTLLGARCEVEGLDYDPVDDALFVTCKVSVPERGVLVVHRLPMARDRDRLAPIEIPRSQLRERGLSAAFEPSAIAVDSAGTLVLVSASAEALIEVDREGRVRGALRLSGERHPQAEGLAFGPDGTLYIADERNGRRPRLTAYAQRDAVGRDR